MLMEVRRRRNIDSKDVDEILSKDFIQSLDVFSKLPDDCKLSTISGGAVTLFTTFLSLLLICSEIRTYMNPDYTYSYEVDKDFETKIQINVDLTIATKCEYTSLDVLDMTGSSLDSNGKIRYRKTSFELPPDRLQSFRHKQAIANELRSNHIDLPNLLWKPTHWYPNLNWLGSDPDNSVSTRSNGVYDACHIVGTLFVRKVAGNLHLIPGKPINTHGGAHLHIAPLVDLAAFNFSHRINHLSFGAHVASRVGPLDAVEQISLKTMDTFQYYISIVPTRIVYAFYTSDTYQYAVTIRNRSTDKKADQNTGIPGVFFTYETFPLLVQINESNELFGTFLARLAALVGGLFATVGLVRQALNGLPQLLLNTRTGRRWQTNFSRLRKHWYGGLANGILYSSTATEPPLNPDSAT